MEGSCRGLVEVLSQHLPGGADKNHENVSQYSWCPYRDSNQVPPEYESTALSIPHLARYYD
jgi:hypothetical protein